MLSKVLCYLRVHAVLLSIMTLLCLYNAIRCRCSWQPCGQSGSAVLPASVTKAFVRFSRYQHIQPSRMRIRLQLQHDLCMSALPCHNVGCATGRTPPLKDMPSHSGISSQYSCAVSLLDAILRYNLASYLPVCLLVPTVAVSDWIAVSQGIKGSVPTNNLHGWWYSLSTDFHRFSAHKGDNADKGDNAGPPWSSERTKLLPIESRVV
jgi:hypothetical protein